MRRAREKSINILGYGTRDGSVSNGPACYTCLERWRGSRTGLGLARFRGKLRLGAVCILGCVLIKAMEVDGTVKKDFEQKFDRAF